MNHFIPSTFWNNSPESISSAEHLLAQENLGHSSTASFQSLWSLKALQSHFPKNLGANVWKHVVPADIGGLDCLEPIATAPRCLMPTRTAGSCGGSSLLSPFMCHSFSMDFPQIFPRVYVETHWNRRAREGRAK